MIARNPKTLAHALWTLALMLVSQVLDAQDTQPVPSRGPQLRGLASVAYVQNVTNPGARNLLRVFDDSAGIAALDLLELAMTWQPVVGLRLRADYVFGERIPAKSASNGLRIGSRADLQQVYASLGSTASRLDLGKFVTPFGVEVIEGYDVYNEQYSRSLLFNYAIPLTHTGARYTRTLSSGTTVAWFGLLGWDNVRASEDRLGVGAQVAGKLTDVASITATYLGGVEPSPTGPVARHVAEVIVNAGLPAGASLSADLVTGCEQEATWLALATYATSPTLGRARLSGRAELFADAGGTRLGIGHHTRVVETTVVPSITLTPAITLRAEARRDWASTAVFQSLSGGSRSQTTIALNLLIHF